ncbi:MAG: hypothetical protein M3167_11625 [Acidobacteriota bacterium]|nr:hypothetical protein [Acidobacteriota bacterium]
MTLRPFDPLRALQTLVRHRVRFVVIGGFAGRLWGSTTVTNDLDVCYARDRKNLKALSGALQELGAALRGAPDGLPFRPDAETLSSGDHFTFTTNAGNLDCLGDPAGSRGFMDLIAGAEPMKLDSVEVAVASLDDLIRLKRAAGRPKDLVELEILGALKEEIEKK